MLAYSRPTRTGSNEVVLVCKLSSLEYPTTKDVTQHLTTDQRAAPPVPFELKGQVSGYFRGCDLDVTRLNMQKLADFCRQVGNAHRCHKKHSRSLFEANSGTCLVDRGIPVRDFPASSIFVSEIM